MSAFLQLTLALAIIILAAKTGGYLAVRLRQPAVLGELLVGLVLGPTIVDLVHLPFVSDPTLLHEEISDLASLGVVFLMFMAGLEVELDEMLHAGRASLLGGTLGVVVPLFMGAVAALPFGYTDQAAWFIGIILTATSVSISAQTLLELGVLKTREGITLLGAAVVDDVLVLVVLSIFLALGGSTNGESSVIVVVAKMVLYLTLSAALGWFVLPRIVAWVDQQPISEGLTAVVVFVTLVFAWSAEVMGGLAAITGAFIAGVGLGRSPLRDKIETKMRILTYGFLVPIFFVSIGLEANVREITGALLPFLIVLFIIAILSKVIGAGLGVRAAGLTRAEALRVGVGMISRGEVGLIVASIGVREGIISPEVFTVVVVLVLLTTLATPLLLRYVFPRPSATRAPG
ncbi:Na(+)/H(+)-K(+) antiporter GerN [Thermoflexales bacterium]|nr:Na(+)/H(+)-K(+) antiporter GerN [Thermoflexales bacterium]